MLDPIYTWHAVIPGQLGASGHWQVVVLKWVVLHPYTADISEHVQVLEQVSVGLLPPLEGGSGTDAPGNTVVAENKQSFHPIL